jgi:hypothetical protein
VLLSDNLSAIVHFLTRVQNQSNTAIDNIFIDLHKITNYIVSHIYSGLSDHDAHLLIVKDLNLQLFKHHIYTIRNIHKYSIEDLKIRLSYECWDSIFGNNGNMDIDSLFSTFLSNYLRIFYTSFSLRKIIERRNNYWITTSIRISSNRKNLYLLSRNNNDVNLKDTINNAAKYCHV